MTNSCRYLMRLNRLGRKQKQRQYIQVISLGQIIDLAVEVVQHCCRQFVVGLAFFVTGKRTRRAENAVNYLHNRGTVRGSIGRVRLPPAPATTLCESLQFILQGPSNK